MEIRKAIIERVVADRILVGEYAPGQLLKEEALAEEFSVSRTPIREILFSLVAIGYAEHERQRGITAPKMELHTVRNLLEAMELILQCTVPLGAARISSEQQEELGNLLLNMHEATVGADIPKFVIAYWTWVQVIIDSAQNEYICQADRRVSFHVHRLRAIAMKGWTGEQVRKSMASTMNYASELVSAFAAHDEEKSKELVVESIRGLRTEIAAAQLGVGWDNADENHRPQFTEPLKAS